MLLTTVSFARAGFLGNPSDGYYGKTIAFTFRQFKAEVTIYESPEVQLVPTEADDALFPNLDALVQDVRLYGYYGGIRLLKATAKVFVEYCRQNDIRLPSKNFTARYRSNIPRLVGLGGSSAICTAMLKGLSRFYDVEIPAEIGATLCWRAEHEELGITCGLQDRVVQMMDGLVFMDFDRALLDERGYGRYEYLDAPEPLARRLYLAYDPSRAEISGVYHRKLRVLFEERQPDIIEAMRRFAEFAECGRRAIEEGRIDDLPELINANFDLRHRIFNVAEENARMVEYARRVGASAKFAGSGGAIVGLYDGEDMYEALVRSLGEIGCRVIRPEIVPSSA